MVPCLPATPKGAPANREWPGTRPSLASLIFVDATENPDQFITIGRADWFTTKTGRILHAVNDDTWTDDHRADMESWGVWTPVRLACGRTAKELYIPGVFTRMGAMRCTGCCRALGGPPGAGSPKNSGGWRKILGLDPPAPVVAPPPCSNVQTVPL